MGVDRLYGYHFATDNTSDGDDSLYGDFRFNSITGDADELFGQSGDDSLYGSGGNDRLWGGRDNDLLDGQSGNDQLDGESGDDELFGGVGADELKGSQGSDDLWGQDGDDLLWGGSASDVLRGGRGSDRLFGESGQDTIYGGDNRDIAYGGSGDDTIYGGNDADVIYAGSGNDQAFGEGGDDLIYAGVGNDAAHGGLGQDQLFGEDGDDQLFGDEGDDYLHGGSSVDLLRGGSGNDQLIAGLGIGNQLYGEGGDDSIIGSDRGAATDPDFTDSTYFGDQIFGGSGDDRIEARGGADFIEGGEGDDWISSGFGSDRVHGNEGDDSIFAADDLGDTVFGGPGRDTIYGSHVGDDFLYGDEGNDEIFGQGGNDRIEGNDGDDRLDGGADTDIVSGGAGYDVLFGGGGVGDQLYGNAGGDVIHGSDDGADIVDGGDGQDTLFGYGGNDQLSGGSGDDVIHGGRGDDILAGGPGEDYLVGEGNHDILYGHSASGTNDDLSVDYLYGDFATGLDQVDSGQDQLFGQGGNDFLFGEGEDDLIVAGGGLSNLVDYGTGESGTPSDFNPPVPTPPPSLVPQATALPSVPTLPQGVLTRGRWHDFAGSGRGLGVSGSTAPASSPDLAIAADGSRYVAWVDSRSGVNQIYVARLDNSGTWTELGNSAGFGGVSNTSNSSESPAITLNGDGNPVTAWVEHRADGTSDVFVAEWDPTVGPNGAWQSLNTSPSGGISQSGTASRPRLVNTSQGVFAAWLDEASTVNVLGRRWNGATWVDVDGSSTGSGISDSTRDVVDFDLDAAAGEIAVAWTASDGTNLQAFVSELSAGTWNAVGNSMSGGGISDSTSDSRQATVAYHNNRLHVAWTEQSADPHQLGRLIGAQFNGSAWQTDEIATAIGDARQPSLASGGGGLYLSWLQDRADEQTSQAQSISVAKWDGTTFSEDIPGEASGRGIGAGVNYPLQLALDVDSAGNPFVIWSDGDSAASSVFLRGNSQPIGQVFEAGSNNVQTIIDANQLGEGDVIVIRGNHTAGFILGADDAGVTILGEEGASVAGNIAIMNAHETTIQNLSVNTLLVDFSDNVNVRDVRATDIWINASHSPKVIESTGYLNLSGAIDAAIVRYSDLDAIELNGTLTNLTILETTARQLDVVSAASGRIAHNRFTGSGSGTVVTIGAGFDGFITQNQISGGSVGLRYQHDAAVSDNEIFDNEIGVEALTDFGFLANTRPNTIRNNTIGVTLNDSNVQNQRIVDNATGVAGVGRLAPMDLDHANIISSNAVGANLDGEIQFNRLGDNTVGVVAHDRQLIAHNMFYNNATGISIAGVDSVRVFNNSLYTSDGINAHLSNGATTAEIRNNILWSETGTNLLVENDSQQGFFSDYNDYHTGVGGTLVDWSLEFDDVLDWQSGLATHDLNSIGTTVVNPLTAEPRFVDRGRGDLSTLGEAVNLRKFDITRDSGDPIIDLALPDFYVNLISNPSFENGTFRMECEPDRHGDDPTNSV